VDAVAQVTAWKWFKRIRRNPLRANYFNSLASEPIEPCVWERKSANSRFGLGFFPPRVYPLSGSEWYRSSGFSLTGCALERKRIDPALSGEEAFENWHE